MTIETIFNINDEVWFIHPKSQQCVVGKIVEIVIKIGSREIMRSGTKRDLLPTGEFKEQRYVHRYYLTDKVNRERIFRDEHTIFSTKELLINSITNY